jgi:hypothetical protein
MVLKKSTRRYQRYVIGCEKYADFFDLDCSPKAQVDSKCRIMRLAYFWPALVTALRTTFMLLVAGIPIGCFLMIPLEAITGSSLIAGGAAVLLGFCYIISVGWEKWVERRWKLKEARRAKEDDPDDLEEPSWFFQLFDRSHRFFCPLVQFEED